MNYDTIRRWVRMHNLTINRANNINWIRDGSSVVRYKRGGTYQLWIDDVMLVEWRAYDLGSVNEAFARVDAAFDVLHQFSRHGWLLPA